MGRKFREIHRVGAAATAVRRGWSVVLGTSATGDARFWPLDSYWTAIRGAALCGCATWRSFAKGVFRVSTDVTPECWPTIWWKVPWRARLRARLIRRYARFLDGVGL